MRQTLGERVIVIGAGIAGLTAAFRLRQAGFDVQVLEASDRVGGRMGTIEKDGYRIDIAAGALSTSYREMLKLIDDVGVADEVVPLPNIVGLVRDGRIHRLNAQSKLSSLMTPYLSNRAKLQMAKLTYDVLRHRKRFDQYDFRGLAALDTESVTDYARRRLDDEVLEYFLETGCEVWNWYPPEQISIVAMLWQIKHFWMGSYFSSRKGVSFLPEALARQLDVRLNTAVTGVEETADGVRVTWQSRQGQGEQTEDASAVVIALPAPAMLKIYPQLDPVRRQIASEFEYTSSVHCGFGLSRIPDEPSYMLFLPRKESDHFLGLGFEHHKLGAAPEGKGLIFPVFRSSYFETHLQDDDDKIVDAAIRLCEQHVLPGVAHDIEMVHVQRLNPCLLRGKVGHFANMVRFQAATNPQSRVQLAGDYFPVTSTNACLVSGEVAAERIRCSVGGTRPEIPRRQT